MTPDSPYDELLGSTPDERLLGEDLGNLPAAVGRPEVLPPSRTRGRLVAIGATLTGVTLLAGIALIALGAVLVLSGGVTLFAIAALLLGASLAGTHWGWVHVAEATAGSIESRRNSDVVARRRSWLEGIEPYTRHEVATTVADDGSITIDRIRYRAVRSGSGRFTFAKETEHVEVHSAGEPAAAIAERAELLRRQAASDTEREHAHFALAAAEYEGRLLSRDEDQQRLQAERAASSALSEQINSNLRDPPLME
jgi:hypothetical protein